MTSMLTGDQEIRVLALEYGSKVLTYDPISSVDDYLASAAKIEAYIRGGKDAG